MLNKANVRSIYSKIQKQLFYMIPEKWDRIYLYASIIEQMNNLETGEMFFYYYPKGILKKEPINVYEVPSKFNIDEESYNTLADNLYDTIKLLREEFESSGEKLWSNITISIENFKFHVEYSYEDLLNSQYNSYDRHMIWKYKYLDFPIERMSKRDREMLNVYLVEESFKDSEVKRYSEGMYKKKVHNIIEYEREEKQVENNSNFDEEIDIQTARKLDKYELYKKNIEEKKKKQNLNTKEEKNINQILKY